MDDTFCCVCYNETQETLYPCNHKMCHSCLIKWWQLKKVTCPMCSQVVCNFSSSENVNDENIRIEFGNKTFPGITIANACSGVKVIRLNKKDECFKQGLRKGVIITNVNNIPCKIGHENVIKIFNTAAEYKYPVSCTIIPEKNTLFSKLLFSNYSFLFVQP